MLAYEPVADSLLVLQVKQHDLQTVFGVTPLLVASPRVGLDLPLKALAWEDETGAVWVSANAPEYLRERHGIPPALIANIAGARGLLAKAAAA